MRHFLALVAFLCLAAPAHAGDKYLGSIVSSGSSVNNQTTATPFKTSSPGLPKWIAIQCTADVRYNTGSGSSTAASSTGVKVSSGTFWELRLTSDEDTLAIIPVSGSATCLVYEVAF